MPYFFVSIKPLDEEPDRYLPASWQLAIGADDPAVVWEEVDRMAKQERVQVTQVVDGWGHEVLRPSWLRG